MFDTGLLPPSRFDFVVITDTHHRLVRADEHLEFANHAWQSARAADALHQAAALPAAFHLHLGDLCQETPGSPNFNASMDGAQQQIAHAGLGALRHVAGNQDIGDKPDPTMPTKTVSPEKLAAFQARFGPTWYEFEVQGMAFIVLNSMLLNGSLPESAEQKAWLTQSLASHRGKRITLFLHIPPYIADPREASLGHYDNLGEPDRSWLLDLIRRHNVEQVMSGHTHFAFYDHNGTTRFHVLCSPSFTRTGFPYLFQSAPPPLRGRDDRAKLGFYLCRVCDDRTDVHFIRTGGPEQLPPRWGELPCPPKPLQAKAGSERAVSPSPPLRLITRLPSSLPHSPLGATFLAPLATEMEQPIAWPGIIRERIRNDYPLLAALELGLRHARVPVSDLADPLQSRRLEILRRDGVRVTAFLLAPASGFDAELLQQHAAQVDGYEIQWAGSALPEPLAWEAIKRLRTSCDVAWSISTVVAGIPVAGKGFPQHRFGYLPDELAALDRALQQADLQLDRVVRQLPPHGAPWDILINAPQVRMTRASGIDWLVTLPGTDDAQNANRAAEALFAASAVHHARIFFEPYVDLDRSMDDCHGLLDTLCNPRPAFHVLRCLNTILHARPVTGPAKNFELPAPPGLRALAWRTPSHFQALLMPTDPRAKSLTFDAPLWDALQEYVRGVLRLYCLAEGTVETVSAANIRAALAAQECGPILVCDR